MGCKKLDTDFFNFLEVVHSEKSAREEKKRLNYYPFGLQQKGYNNVIQNENSVATNFGYNGKENNPELGLEFMDFGARNYDAALGRWMNIDPLADLMRRHSPYNYAFDNPIYFIDPDGMMPTGPPDVKTSVTNKRGDENYVVRDINITLTLTVLNSSGADLSNTMFSDNSGSVSLDGFKGLAQSSNSELGVTNQDIIQNVTVNYNVVESIDDIGENDHVLIVANDIPKGGRVDNIDPAGIAQFGGRVSAVEKSAIENGSFDETAQHEIGHNLGLDDNTGGIMNWNRDRTKTNKATNRQKGEIISKQLSPRSGEGTYRESESGSWRYAKPIGGQVRRFINSNNIDY